MGYRSPAAALWVLALFLASALGGAYGDYLSAKQKLDQLETGHLRPGSRVVLSPGEINAYAEQLAPQGVRNPKVEITAPGLATGSALVDFAKLRQSEGHAPGWLLSKLLDGERPVSVTARITSSAGHAQVDPQRVEISGLEINGQALDFLIQNFLLRLYPDAAVGRPFELGNHIERLEIEPRGVNVLIGR